MPALDLSTLIKRKGFWWRDVVGAVLLLLAVFAYLTFYAPNSFGDAQTKTVYVARGASFKSVLDSLENAQAVRWRWSISLAGRILGWTKEMKVGKYEFESGISNLDILRSLREGDYRVFIAVSIAEGRRYQAIARRFARELALDSAKFVSLCTDSSYVRELGLDAPTLEGYLLPDTYKFMWQTDEEQIIERMVKEFRSFYNDSLENRQRELNMTLNQILTLASIVEGEAVLDNERARIAGVYYNRLKKRMRLEADPTIQFLLPDGPRRLLYSDLNRDSPYNTYRNYGLPPGPINSPGRKSILAVLYPENHEYLYFVADGNGGHTFSKTFSEHQRAARKYRRMMNEVRANSGR